VSLIICNSCSRDPPRINVVKLRISTDSYVQDRSPDVLLPFLDSILWSGKAENELLHRDWPQKISRKKKPTDVLIRHLASEDFASDLFSLWRLVIGTGRERRHTA
jgi:hypothetical protein